MTDRLQALEELKAKVEAFAGTANFPASEHDVEVALRKTHKCLTDLVSILIEQEKADD